MRSSIVSTILLVSAFGMTGCREPEENFGEILTNMSQVTGSDIPYELPDLGEIEDDEARTKPGQDQGPPVQEIEDDHSEDDSSGHAHD